MARVAELPPHSGTMVSAEHAFATAAPHLTLLDLVIAGDWLVRLRRCSPDSLTAYTQRSRGRGAVLARRAARLVRARVDSPRETRLRLVLVLAGLPEPVCNPRVGNNEGPIGCVDLVYWAYRLLMEYEGDQHRTDRQQWNLDIDRAEAFAREDLTLIRVTAHRMRRPRELVRRVYIAMKAGGYDGPEPVFNGEWRALFET